MNRLQTCIDSDNKKNQFMPSNKKRSKPHKQYKQHPNGRKRVSKACLECQKRHTR